MLSDRIALQCGSWHFLPAARQFSVTMRRGSTMLVNEDLLQGCRAALDVLKRMQAGRRDLPPVTDVEIEAVELQLVDAIALASSSERRFAA